MVVDEIIEKASKKAQGVQASLGRTESTDISFENDRLKTVKTAQRTRISVKVIVDGKVGSSHTTDPSDVDGVVKRAVEAAAFGSPAHFTFPGPASVEEVAVFDDAVTKVTKDEMVHLGEEMVTRLKDYNQEILVDAGVRKSLGNGVFANSSGLRFEKATTRFDLGVQGQILRGTDILAAGRSHGSRNAAVDHLDIAQKVVWLFNKAEKTATIRSGTLPVIFPPKGMNVLVLPLRLGLNGKNVFLGSSPLAGKLGKVFVDSQLSLTDHPLIDYGTASGQYDGEGVPHQITPLIERGELKQVLYDLDTAGRAGTTSTGHGVGCSPTNLVIEEGDTSFEEMVKHTKEGLMVFQVLGLGQGNPISGEFSVNVHLGYKVENGEIVGRVKNVMLAGNAYDALKRIVAVGDKAEWVSGALLTPPMQVDGLSVVAK